MIDSIGEFLSQSRSIYLFLAVTGTTLFAIQLIMSIAGIHAGDADLDPMGADFDTECDLAGHGDLAQLNFFSLKSIVAFVTFFGWAGVFWGESGYAGFFIAIGCGAVMMILVTLVIYLLLRMQDSGTVASAQLVGRPGTVYLGIPAGRQPGGLATVQLPNSTLQVKAVSDTALATGTPIRVKAVISGECYLVEPIS